MPSPFEFCLPTSAAEVPDHPVWLHEVKYDGYRLIVARDGTRVRLITRGGYDWAGRFPWIVAAALKNRHQQFVIDGEAVLLGVDGVSDFNALHSRRRDDQVQLYAFDILALDGDDLRGRTVRAGRDRPRVVQGGVRHGLEGLLSKRTDRPYRAGRSKDWVKVKNRKHPAMHRVKDAFS